MSNPLLYGSLILPIDAIASAPSISFGGGPRSQSDTGIYGQQGEINFSINGLDILRITEDGLLGPDFIYDGAGSFQPLAIDLEIDPDAGKDLVDGTAFLAPIMGNLLGSTSTKTGNYLAGAIGAISLSGAISTHLQSAAVMGIAMDGVTDVQACVMAVIDGDSSQTNVDAAFAVRMNNSIAGSGMAVGLDLYAPAHDGFSALVPTVAEIRFSNGVKVTVSGDDIVFTNAAGNKSATLTMT